MSYYYVAAVIITAAVGYGQQVEATEDQEEAALKQADQEKVSAEAKELGRRQKLNRALAANVVGQSTAGIAGEGTPESIALESAKQVSISEGVTGLSDKLKQAQIKRNARNNASAANAQSASTFLSTSITAAQSASNE